MKILHLTLQKKPFEVTLSGEKKIEYRQKSNWIESRLFDKEYDLVKFVNGYGAHLPFMIFEFLRWEEARPAIHSFSNGLVVNVKKGDYAIYLGKLIETGNIK